MRVDHHRSAHPARTAVLGGVAVVVVPVLTTLIVVLGPAGGARALSCAGWPSDDPVVMYATRLGPDAAPTDVGVPDRWEGAVVGTVTDVRGSGPVDVVVDVDATLGPRLGARVALESPDAGEVSGYAFEVGRRYVVPYVVEDGALHSFLCDPVLQVDEAQVEPLLAAAEAGDWAGRVHRPQAASVAETSTGADDAPVAGADGHEAPSAGPLGAGVLLGGAVTAGAGALGLGLRRRRRSGR